MGRTDLLKCVEVGRQMLRFLGTAVLLSAIVTNKTASAETVQDFRTWMNLTLRPAASIPAEVARFVRGRSRKTGVIGQQVAHPQPPAN
jgi:hypothetical protein